ncbi:MAG: ABC transporter substrate-binding protein, partial [Chloroflexota bacterium]
ALENGDIHFSIHDIPAGAVDEWKAKEGIDVLVHSGNSIGFLAFNWTQDRFKDHAVREAIARAIDRKEIADAIHPGIPTPRHYYLEKVSWAFNPDAVAPDYDEAAAEKLLDEAGYARDSEGIRFRVTISARELYPHYNIAAAVIAEQLGRIGIEARTESLSPVDWLERIQKQGDFDLAMDAGDIGPDPQQMASFLASDGPRNIMRYSNPIVDEAFREGRATPNKQERGEHYRRLQSALAADIARVPLLQYGEYLPYSDKFTGWSWSDGVRGTVPFWYHGKVRKVE